jgi:hypothetical protein
MSLGNVSYSYINEQYFRQALLYLRRASELSGYTLSPYLQKYVYTSPFYPSVCALLEKNSHPLLLSRYPHYQIGDLDRTDWYTAISIITVD